MTGEKDIPDAEGAVSEEIDEGETIAWTCHPVKRKPLVSAAVSVLILVVGITVQYIMQSPLFAVFSMVVVFGALAKFYWPTSYRLSDRRIMVKTTTQTLHKDWKIYRSCYADKNGVLLSPFEEPSRLENFRGLYIMFNNNRDEVIAFVRARVGGKHLESKAAINDKSTDEARS
ncbi:MAG: hypothetical protein GY867_02765 [bacterium]|nr:hypothetical protein [bacterium]